MDKKTPTVSILLPIYNRAVLLERGIKSVFAQTFSDWELILIDDASTDDTPNVVKQYVAMDKRVVSIRNEKNVYITAALNQGLAAARGEFIARLDDDDYWLDPDKLKKQVEFLRTHPDYAVVGGGVVVIDGEGKERFRYFKKETDEEIRRTALSANPFTHTTVMFRAEAARAEDGYGTERYAEDWELWLKMGTKGKLYNFPEYFTAYTMATTNRSFIHQRPQTVRVLKFITAHRHDYPGFLKGYIVNGTQYLFSFFPESFRHSLHTSLISIKRKLF
jgi:glycosyltransferase involved in cell wall biosynthesis